MSLQGEDLFAKGQLIDRYEIRDLIGQGGMGAVYRALDTKLGRTVALKTVVAHRRGALLTDDMRQRFMREALAASKVDHRNVVQVLDFGIVDDGTPYLVMEFLRGQDLGVLLKNSREPLAVDYVVDIMLGVCAALRACHHVGIIHRDLKPANIFLCETDTGAEVKVLDFGVSKLALDGSITEDGQILGTPQYLSPEQVEGRVVPESDQYALGMLLYACLTRELPYQGMQHLALLHAITNGNFEPPRARRPDIPEKLEAIILQAMRVSPAERFPSVHALGQKLWEFATPRGREQWKNYYFHTPPVPFARPEEETSGSIPMLQVLAARGLRALTPESTGTSETSNERGGLPGATQVLGRTIEAEPAVFPPQANLSTKIAQPTPAPGAGRVSPSIGFADTAGASGVLSDAALGGGGRRGRIAITLVVLAAIAAAGALWFRANRQPAARGVTPPPVATPAPAAPVAPPPAPPVAPPQPAAKPTVEPAPAAAAVAVPPVAPAQEPKPASKDHHATGAHKHRAPHPHANANIDPHGIGIPSE